MALADSETTAGITFNLMPGPTTIYIVGRSIAQGRHASFCPCSPLVHGALAPQQGTVTPCYNE